MFSDGAADKQVSKKIMRKVEVALKTRANLGECPRWDEKSQKLYWVDINQFELHCFDPATGEDSHLTFNEEIGCFALREGSDGFVLAMRNGLFLTDGWNTNLQKVCDPEEGKDKNRFNDGRCDAKGRLLAGSYYPPKDYDGANFWSFEKAEASLLIPGLLTANGAAFSPDNTRFYHADTPKHKLFVSDYDLDSGVVSNTRIFREFEHGKGRPDGGSVDQDGFYWSALYEGSRIVRMNPQGDIVETIEIPAKCPTMCAFGGDDMRTLFITTVGNRPEEEFADYPDAGSIFSVKVDVPGMHEHRFVSA